MSNKIQPTPQPGLHRLPLRHVRLPTADALLPYLRKIDEAQWYSNFGALVTSFEARLAAHFGVTPENVATAANGTLGLVAALQVQGVAPGKLCAMPSFTFAATPAAAVAAGLKPYFIDVDRTSWALEPVAVEAALADAPAEIGAVIPVSPFGGPLDVEAWDAFAARTGIAVVLDAAWAFDTLSPGIAPAVVSLHATKVLGIGEGGIVLARKLEWITGVKQLTNFGINAEREASTPGGNSKMSEYAAAVGHAALDAWPTNKAAHLAVAATYRNALEDILHIRLPAWFGIQAGAVCPVELAAPVGVQVIDALRRHDIEARLWWGRPCHLHPAYRDCKRASLPNTDWLAPRVLCLPFYAELTTADITRVRDVFAAIVGSEI